MYNLDLIMLGMLKEKPVSTYEMVKRIRREKMNEYCAISSCKVYERIKKFKEEGFVETTCKEKSNIYKLTPYGEIRFYELMKSKSKSDIEFQFDVNTVIACIYLVGEDERNTYLNNIKEKLKWKKRILSSYKKNYSSDILYKQQIALIEVFEKYIDDISLMKK